MANPEKDFEKIGNALDKPLEKNIQTSDMVVAETKPRKRAKRINTQLKDIIAQRVATMDYLGFSKREAAAMITNELYPDGDGEFTPKQYVHWLNNLKAAKLMSSDYYAKTGIVLDVMDMNETLKMAYQWTLREMRREIMRKEGDRKDKGYIIKLGHLITVLADERQKLLFSVPIVSSVKSVVDRSKGVVDDIKKHYPSVLEVSDAGVVSVRVPLSEYGTTRDHKKDYTKSVDEAAEGEKSGSTGSEGTVQSDDDDRSVSSTDGAAGTTAPERVFG